MRALAGRDETKTTLLVTDDQMSQAAALDPRGLNALPRELAEILSRTLEIIARGGTVTLGALPEEVTTTTAADMLGISRPTLMKLLREKALPSRKVGSHARIPANEVLAYRDRKRAERRAAFTELREFEDTLPDS